MMSTLKERKKQTKDAVSASRKRADQDKGGDTRQPGHLPGSTYFEQRYLGNNYLQSTEEESQIVSSVEKKIAELPTESSKTLLSVANMANDLVDDWHTGALGAVKDFTPKVLIEFNLALAGNLLWAASVLTKNPWGYIPMAFIGAYISGMATEDYGFDEAVKASREGYASRMHELRNKLENNMDKILYNPLTSYGFEAFLKLSFEEKRRLAWSWIFTIDWNNGKVIEASKEAALHNLQKCDRRTELFLKHLHRCWTKSFTSYGADPLGQHYWLLDEDEWYKQTSFPLEEYAGRSAPGINMQRIRNKNLPPPISLDFVNRRNTKIFISFVAKLPKPA